jgi:hypothetical protein
MSDLGELLIENYRRHPSFQFESKALKDDDNLLREFEVAYNNPKEFEKPEEISERFRRCTEIAKSIFFKLCEQTDDSSLKKLIQELEFRFLQYLDEEFRIRRKVRLSQVNSRRASENSKVQSLVEVQHYFGSLSERATKNINSVAESKILEFRKLADNGFLGRKDLSVDSGEIVRKICEEIDIEFHMNGAFKTISSYFGVKYDHVGLSLELSDYRSSWWHNTLEETSAPQTMYAHLDENFFAPKAIVYLTKVCENSGPTKLYPKAYSLMKIPAFKDIVGRVVGSVVHNPEVKNLYRTSNGQLFSSVDFRKDYMKLPESIRFNSHFGWDIEPNSYLESELAAMENVFLGEPGNFIVFDGAQLLHRGGLIEKGQRVVLQVVFQVSNPSVRRRIWKTRIRGFLRKFNLS